MRLICLVLLLNTGLAQRVQDVPASDLTAIRAVVLSQLEAFKKGDGVLAFSFAAPNIRSVFGTPERFIEMVQTGYPEIYRPISVEFGKAVRSAGALGQVSQLITFIGQDGKKVVALYQMERQPDGIWKIAGVQTQEADVPGA